MDSTEPIVEGGEADDQENSAIHGPLHHDTDIVCPPPICRTSSPLTPPRRPIDDDAIGGSVEDDPEECVKNEDVSTGACIIKEVPSSAEMSREVTVQASNCPGKITNNSQVSSHCSSSSQISVQKDWTSAYTNNTTDTNSMVCSESEEGISNIAGRYNRLLELSTVSYASTETSGSVLLDNTLLDPSAAFNFAMEHRIFLNAALNLLNEKDSTAPELGMRDPIILKAGSLKKASQLMNGVWKVKYVEVRRGMFSYYEKNTVSSTDDRQGELLLRKNIPLEASICTCRAVKLHQKALNFSPGGAIFELASSNNSNIRRLWMATSREERQTWIQAINSAMVGGSVTRGDSLVDHRGLVRTVSGRSPFKADLRMYIKCQSAIRTARTATEYLAVIRELLDKSLDVPIKWIAKQGVLLGGESSTGHGNSAFNAFQEETVELSVDQLWRDLQRDSVCINGEVLRGDSGHGPERILGALTKCLLMVGKQDDDVASPTLRESKALRYSRDILLAGNRTRSGGDSYYCVNALCGHVELVVVVPSGVEVQPVKIEVTEDDSDESFHQRFIDKSGWIKTKTRIQRTWRKYFFVLSEGTLSAYEGATPRPHGLKFQGAIADASVSISKQKGKDNSDDPGSNLNYVVTISTKDGSSKEYLLLFESVDKLVDWIYAFECVLNAKPTRRPSRTGTTPTETKSSMNKVLSLAEQSTLEHTKLLNLDEAHVKRRLEKVSQRATVAVRVSVEATTYYKVCTTDPTGDEELDTWATIEAQFFQAFRITGGSNSQIARGEELVSVKVTSCLSLANPPSNDVSLSPTTMRARLNRRIFRHPSSIEENDFPIAIGKD